MWVLYQNGHFLENIASVTLKTPKFLFVVIPQHKGNNSNRLGRLKRTDENQYEDVIKCSGTSKWLSAAEDVTTGELHLRINTGFILIWFFSAVLYMLGNINKHSFCY